MAHDQHIRWSNPKGSDPLGARQKGAPARVWQSAQYAAKSAMRIVAYARLGARGDQRGVPHGLKSSGFRV